MRIFGILILLLLCSCAQTTSMFGPAVTVASTGNVYQAGFSYGVGKTVEATTGKTTIENIKILLEPKDQDKDTVKKIKEKINKSAKIKNLLNQ